MHHHVSSSLPYLRLTHVWTTPTHSTVVSDDKCWSSTANSSHHHTSCTQIEWLVVLGAVVVNAEAKEGEDESGSDWEEAKV